MKKAILLLVISILLFPNTFCVYASNIEKGNPTATYYWDKIILSNGNEIDLNENTTLLFLNGTLITDYEIIIRNDRALVPVRLIAQELGAFVDWDGSNRIVTITKAQKEITLTIDSSTAFVNGAEISSRKLTLTIQDYICRFSL